jgi:hypothetical protein
MFFFYSLKIFYVGLYDWVLGNLFGTNNIMIWYEWENGFSLFEKRIEEIMFEFRPLDQKYVIIF